MQKTHGSAGLPINTTRQDIPDRAGGSLDPATYRKILDKFMIAYCRPAGYICNCGAKYRFHCGITTRAFISMPVLRGA